MKKYMLIFQCAVFIFFMQKTLNTQPIIGDINPLSLKLTNNHWPKIAQSHNLIQNFSHNEQKKNETQRNNEIYSTLRMVAEIVDLIEQKGYREVSIRKIMEEGFKAALPHVDAHSAFFTPNSYKQTIESTSGEFSGIGVSVISKDLADDWIIVTDVIEGGPSDKAGLQAGDKIIEIDKKKLRGLTSDEVINLLRGPIKTKITIKILRHDKPVDGEFIVTRDIIKNEVASSFFFKDYNIYYISLKLFSDNAMENIAKYIKIATKNKCKGIILDLSGNPGGILNSAVDVAELFVDKDSLIVSTKNRKREKVGEYKTKKDPIFDRKMPLFLLTNNFSASASEILAGALKHHSKLDNDLMVFLVGSKTFGKGSVQEVIPLSNGSALKLTSMLYYLPDGSSIQPEGIEPDFVVPPKVTPSVEIKWLEEFYGRESSLQRHITKEEAEGKPRIKKAKPKILDKKELSWEDRFKKRLQQNMPLRAAVNLINIYNLATKACPNKINTRDKAIAFLKSNYITDEDIIIEKVK